jgi:hypothetical protein
MLLLFEGVTKFDDWRFFLLISILLSMHVLFLYLALGDIKFV